MVSFKLGKDIEKDAFTKKNIFLYFYSKLTTELLSYSISKI